MDKNINNKDYLGDGVYVIHEGYGIWIYANDLEYPTDKIFLDEGLIERLVNFDKRIKSQLSKEKV